MNTKMLAVTVTGLFLLSTLVVAPVKAQPVPATGFNIVDVTWGSVGNLTQVGAGSQDVPLIVTTQYYFFNTANGMVATLSLPAGFTNMNGGSSPSAYISGTVPTNTVVTFTFYLDIASNTPVGTYTFPITLQWGVTPGGQYNSVSLVQVSNLTVQMNGKVKLTFQAEPTSISPGEVNDVAVTLTNTGSGPASQISTVVSSSQLLSVVNSLPDVANLGPNSSVEATLQVFAASTSAGTPVALSFTATYTDAYGTTRSVSQSVGFFVAPLPTTSPVGIAVDTTSLQAGLVNNFTVTLSDQGTSPIEGLSATFSFVGGVVTWLSPAIVQAQAIDPGGSITVQARAYDPATSAGSATLQGILSYSYDNVTVQETRSIGLLSRGQIDIELTGATVLPQQVAQGQIVSITLTITNVGIITASAVTAQAQMPQWFRSIGASSDFVGDMAVDSPSTFTLSALVTNSTPPGTYRVPVTLSYFDNLRTPLSTTVNASVSVVSGAAASGGSSQSKTASRRGGGLFGFPIFILAALVVVAIVAIYARRRRSSRS